MKKIVYIIFILILLIASLGCTNEKYYCKRFISNYGDEDFSGFINKGFVKRGYKGDSRVIFASTDLNNAYNNGPYVVEYNITQDTVQGSCHLMTDSLSFNRNEIHDLTLKFLKYNVQRLKVESDGSVHVYLYDIEDVSIIRFENDILPEKYKDWEHIEGKWYFKG